MKRKFIGILLGIIMVFSLVGCANSEKPMNDIDENHVKKEDIEEPDNNVDDEEVEKNEDENKDKNQEEEEKDEPTSNIDEKKEEEVVLYFANKEYIETGNESLEKLIGEKRIVEYNSDNLEESIIKELKKGPKSDKLETVIPDTIKILDVKVSNNTAFVNFDKEGLSGGSMEEDFILSQIMDTLFELEHINKIQFLINGEKAESLMGHFDISEPFKE